MATKLKSFDFTAHTGGRRYPWEDWADGSVWELKHGEDFNGSPRSFRTQVYKYGGEHGLKARTHIDGDRFVLQFLPRT